MGTPAASDPRDVQPWFPTELPGWIYQYLLGGGEWPDGSESRTRDAAQAFADMHQLMVGAGQDGSQGAQQVGQAIASGVSKPEFDRLWASYVGSGGSIPAATRQYQETISSLLGYADSIEYAKWSFNIQTAFAVAEWLTAVAFAIVTRGLSLGEYVTITLPLRKEAVRTIVSEVLEELFFSGAPELVTQAVMHPDNVADWDWAAIGQNAFAGALGGFIGGSLGNGVTKLAGMELGTFGRAVADFAGTIPGQAVNMAAINTLAGAGTWAVFDRNPNSFWDTVNTGMRSGLLSGFPYAIPGLVAKHRTMVDLPTPHGEAVSAWVRDNGKLVLYNEHGVPIGTGKLGANGGSYQWNGQVLPLGGPELFGTRGNAMVRMSVGPDGSVTRAAETRTANGWTPVATPDGVTVPKAGSTYTYDGNGALQSAAVVSDGGETTLFTTKPGEGWAKVGSIQTADATLTYTDAGGRPLAMADGATLTPAHGVEVTQYGDRALVFSQPTESGSTALVVHTDGTKQVEYFVQPATTPVTTTAPQATLTQLPAVPILAASSPDGNHIALAAGPASVVLTPSAAAVSVTVDGSAGQLSSGQVAAAMLHFDAVQNAVGHGTPILLESTSGGIHNTNAAGFAQEVANALTAWASPAEPARVTVSLGDVVGGIPGGPVEVGDQRLVLPAAYARLTVTGSGTGESYRPQRTNMGAVLAMLTRFVNQDPLFDVTRLVTTSRTLADQLRATPDGAVAADLVDEFRQQLRQLLQYDRPDMGGQTGDWVRDAVLAKALAIAKTAEQVISESPAGWPQTLSRIVTGVNQELGWLTGKSGTAGGLAGITQRVESVREWLAGRADTPAELLSDVTALRSALDRLRWPAGVPLERPLGVAAVLAIDADRLLPRVVGAYNGEVRHELTAIIGELERIPPRPVTHGPVPPTSPFGVGERLANLTSAIERAASALSTVPSNVGLERLPVLLERYRGVAADLSRGGRLTAGQAAAADSAHRLVRDIAAELNQLSQPDAAFFARLGLANKIGALDGPLDTLAARTPTPGEAVREAGEAANRALALLDGQTSVDGHASSVAGQALVAAATSLRDAAGQLQQRIDRLLSPDATAFGWADSLAHAMTVAREGEAAISAALAGQVSADVLHGIVDRLAGITLGVEVTTQDAVDWNLPRIEGRDKHLLAWMTANEGRFVVGDRTDLTGTPTLLWDVPNASLRQEYIVVAAHGVVSGVMLGAERLDGVRLAKLLLQSPDFRAQVLSGKEILLEVCDGGMPAVDNIAQQLADTVTAWRQQFDGPAVRTAVRAAQGLVMVAPDGALAVVGRQALGKHWSHLTPGDFVAAADAWRKVTPAEDAKLPANWLASPTATNDPGTRVLPEAAAGLAAGSEDNIWSPEHAAYYAYGARFDAGQRGAEQAMGQAMAALNEAARALRDTVGPVDASGRRALELLDSTMERANQLAATGDEQHAAAVAGSAAAIEALRYGHLAGVTDARLAVLRLNVARAADLVPIGQPGNLVQDIHELVDRFRQHIGSAADRVLPQADRLGELIGRVTPVPEAALAATTSLDGLVHIIGAELTATSRSDVSQLGTLADALALVIADHADQIAEALAAVAQQTTEYPDLAVAAQDAVKQLGALHVAPGLDLAGADEYARAQINTLAAAAGEAAQQLNGWLNGSIVDGPHTEDAVVALAQQASRAAEIVRQLTGIAHTGPAESTARLDSILDLASAARELSAAAGQLSGAPPGSAGPAGVDPMLAHAVLQGRDAVAALRQQAREAAYNVDSVMPAINDFAAAVDRLSRVGGRSSQEAPVQEALAAAIWRAVEAAGLADQDAGRALDVHHALGERTGALHAALDALVAAQYAAAAAAVDHTGVREASRVAAELAQQLSVFTVDTGVSGLADIIAELRFQADMASSWLDLFWRPEDWADPALHSRLDTIIALLRDTTNQVDQMAASGSHAELDRLAGEAQEAGETLAYELEQAARTAVPASGQPLPTVGRLAGLAARVAGTHGAVGDQRLLHRFTGQMDRLSRLVSAWDATRATADPKVLYRVQQAMAVADAAAVAGADLWAATVELAILVADRSGGVLSLRANASALLASLASGQFTATSTAPEAARLATAVQTLLDDLDRLTAAIADLQHGSGWVDGARLAALSWAMHRADVADGALHELFVLGPDPFKAYTARAEADLAAVHVAVEAAVGRSAGLLDGVDLATLSRLDALRRIVAGSVWSTPHELTRSTVDYLNRLATAVDQVVTAAWRQNLAGALQPELRTELRGLLNEAADALRHLREADRLLGGRSGWTPLLAEFAAGFRESADGVLARLADLAKVLGSPAPEAVAPWSPVAARLRADAVVRDAQALAGRLPGTGLTASAGERLATIAELASEYHEMVSSADVPDLPTVAELTRHVQITGLIASVAAIMHDLQPVYRALVAAVDDSPGEAQRHAAEAGDGHELLDARLTELRNLLRGPDSGEAPGNQPDGTPPTTGDLPPAGGAAPGSDNRPPDPDGGPAGGDPVPVAQSPIVTALRGANPPAPRAVHALLTRVENLLDGLDARPVLDLPAVDEGVAALQAELITLHDQLANRDIAVAALPAGLPALIREARHLVDEQNWEYIRSGSPIVLDRLAQGLARVNAELLGIAVADFVPGEAVVKHNGLRLRVRWQQREDFGVLRITNLTVEPIRGRAGEPLPGVHDLLPDLRGALRKERAWADQPVLLEIRDRGARGQRTAQLLDSRAIFPDERLTPQAALDHEWREYLALWKAVGYDTGSRMWTVLWGTHRPPVDVREGHDALADLFGWADPSRTPAERALDMEIRRLGQWYRQDALALRTRHEARMAELKAVAPRAAGAAETARHRAVMSELDRQYAALAGSVREAARRFPQPYPAPGEQFTGESVTVREREMTPRWSARRPGPLANGLGVVVDSDIEFELRPTIGPTGRPGTTYAVVRVALDNASGLADHRLELIKAQAALALERIANEPLGRPGAPTLRGATVQLRVEFIDAAQASEGQHVVVVRGDGLDNERTWFSDSVGTLFAHELLHRFGLPDEYFQQDDLTPGRTTMTAPGVHEEPAAADLAHPTTTTRQHSPMAFQHLPNAPLAHRHAYRIIQLAEQAMRGHLHDHLLPFDGRFRPALDVALLSREYDAAPAALRALRGLPGAEAAFQAARQLANEAGWMALRIPQFATVDFNEPNLEVLLDHLGPQLRTAGEPLRAVPEAVRANDTQRLAQLMETMSGLAEHLRTIRMAIEPLAPDTGRSAVQQIRWTLEDLRDGYAPELRTASLGLHVALDDFANQLARLEAGTGQWSDSAPPIQVAREALAEVIAPMRATLRPGPGVRVQADLSQALDDYRAVLASKTDLLRQLLDPPTFVRLGSTEDFSAYPKWPGSDAVLAAPETETATHWRAYEEQDQPFRNADPPFEHPVPSLSYGEDGKGKLVGDFFDAHGVLVDRKYRTADKSIDRATGERMQGALDYWANQPVANKLSGMDMAVPDQLIQFSRLLAGRGVTGIQPVLDALAAFNVDNRAGERRLLQLLAESHVVEPDKVVDALRGCRFPGKWSAEHMAQALVAHGLDRIDANNIVWRVRDGVLVDAGVADPAIRQEIVDRYSGIERKPVDLRVRIEISNAQAAEATRRSYGSVDLSATRGQLLGRFNDLLRDALGLARQARDPVVSDLARQIGEHDARTEAGRAAIAAILVEAGATDDAKVARILGVLRDGWFPRVEIAHVPVGESTEHAGEKFHTLSPAELRQFHERITVGGYLEQSPWSYVKDTSPDSVDAMLYEWQAAQRYGGRDGFKPALLYTPRPGARPEKVRFDALDGRTLVERKLFTKAKTFSQYHSQFEKQVNALEQHPELRLRLEVPNEELAAEVRGHNWTVPDSVRGRVEVAVQPFNHDEAVAQYRRWTQARPPTFAQLTDVTGQAGVFDIRSDDPQSPARVQLTGTPSGWCLRAGGPAGDEVALRAGKLAAQPGVVDIVGHATPQGFLVGGLLLPFTAVFDRIGPLAGTAVIRLIACDAGGSTAAAALAAALGREVVAPDTPVWLTADGNVVAATPADAAGNPRPKGPPPDGTWRVFLPGGGYQVLQPGDPRLPQAPDGWEHLDVVHA
jgi:hypothetical protein